MLTTYWLLTTVYWLLSFRGIEGAFLPLMASPTPTELTPETLAFYVRALQALNKARAPYLVGGAYAFGRYTGIERHTKDFDIFVKHEDLEPVLKVLARLGCHVEPTFPHWLAKAYSGDDFIDVIFGAGNGVATVDDGWFEHAVDSPVLGIASRLIPAEEMIWSKAFVMERERYDGADVAHILHARAEQMDWDRLIERFADYHRVLLVHLLLFGFIYPAERTRIPKHVIDGLIARVEPELEANDRRNLCQGTLLSREQYLIDVTRGSYQDARQEPRGTLSKEDIAHWTAAIKTID